MNKNATEKSYSDWKRIDAMTDEDIDTSEIPPLDEAFFTAAQQCDAPSSGRM